MDSVGRAAMTDAELGRAAAQAAGAPTKLFIYSLSKEVTQQDLECLFLPYRGRSTLVMGKKGGSRVSAAAGWQALATAALGRAMLAALRLARARRRCYPSAVR